ncbi:MAG: NrsF family protein [Pseudomonadota bacterium]
MSKDDLIDSLVADLTPVKTPIRAARRAVVWWVGAMLFTAATMLFIAPFRSGFAEQLVTAPRFALEIIVGFVTAALLARATFELAVPDDDQQRWHVRIAVIITAVWLLLLVTAYWSPVLPPSMAGKRPHCYAEVMAFGIPLTVMALVQLRSLYVLHPLRAGLTAGLAGGIVPAFMMQLACMHDPWHILTHHIAPLLVTVTAGGIGGLLLLRRQEHMKDTQ